MDSDFVHQSQPGLRIEGSFVYPVEAHLHGVEEWKLRAVARNDSPAAGESNLVAVDHPSRQPLALLHVEDTVLVPLRGSARPEVVGLRVVGVCVDDLEVFGQMRHIDLPS